jgi:Zn-dependent membrane protease YugP
MEFGGRQDRRSLHIHSDCLECCGVRIAMEAVTGVRVVKNPVTAISQYDLEVEVAGCQYTFPNAGLAPGSEYLAQLNQALPWGPVGQIEPIVLVSTLGSKQLQLFEERIRIKDFNYRHWPDDTSSIPFTNIREIRYLERSRLLSDVFIQMEDGDVFIASCTKTGAHSFEAGLKRIAPRLAQRHFRPLAVMKFLGPTGGEAVSAYMDGLAAVTQFIPYEQLVGLRYEKLDEVRWSMTIHSRKGSIRCSPIGLVQALPLKHRIEAICSDLPIEIIGAHSIEEDLQRQKTKVFSTILVFVCLLLLIGAAYFVIDSGLIAQIAGRAAELPTAIQSSSSSDSSNLHQILLMALPLLGILAFFVPYTVARNVKEGKLDTHHLLGGLTAEEAANRLGRLQGTSSKIVSIGDETVMRYDPFTKTLCLPASALQSRSVASAVAVAHELAHYTQSLKIGNFSLMTIKSLERLIKKISVPLVFVFTFTILVGAVLRLHEFVLVIVGIFLPVYLFELLIMAGSLIIELDADRRARSMLKQTDLLHRDDFQSVSQYLLCLSLIRVLMYVAFFLPAFGVQYRHFEKNRAILI